MAWDPIDLVIIEALAQEGRLKLTEIGEKVGLSHVAVKNRIEKLQEKMIKIQANLNVNALNWMSAYILLETHDYDSQRRFVEKFRLCPRVHIMDLISGQYNIILRVLAPSMQNIDCFITNSIKSEDRLRNMQILYTQTNVKPKYLPIQEHTLTLCDQKRAPCGSNCIFCGMYKDGACSGCPATNFPEKQAKYQESLKK